MSHLFIFLALIPSRVLYLMYLLHCVTACSYKMTTCHFFLSKFSVRLKQKCLKCILMKHRWGLWLHCHLFQPCWPQQACHQIDRFVCICFTWSTTTAWWVQIKTCPTHAYIHTHTVAPNSMENIRCCETNVCLFFSIFLFVVFFYVLVWINCNVIYSLLSVVFRYLWIYCCNFRQKIKYFKNMFATCGFLSLFNVLIFMKPTLL